MAKENDDFGNRMKAYEAGVRSALVYPGTPIVARLDGKGFSKVTKKMVKPYDVNLSSLMVSITQYLMKTFGAKIGYTQSDEITLVWYSDGAEYPFGGRLQKFDSLLAAGASAAFNKYVTYFLKDDVLGPDLVMFDCRTFPVPNLMEARNAVLWRMFDCKKNAISMAAHYHLGHKACMNKNGEQKIEMMAAAGVNYYDYPEAFRKGTLLSVQEFEAELDADQLAAIPEAHRPAPGTKIKRSKTVQDYLVPAFVKSFGFNPEGSVR